MVVEGIAPVVAEGIAPVAAKGIAPMAAQLHRHGPMTAIERAHNLDGSLSDREE